MKKTTKKLTLRRETLFDLGVVLGGVQTASASCPPPPPPPTNNDTVYHPDPTTTRNTVIQA